MKQDKSYEFNIIKQKISEQKNIINEINLTIPKLDSSENSQKRLILQSQIESLKKSLINKINELFSVLENLSILPPLTSERDLIEYKKTASKKNKNIFRINLDPLEKISFERLFKKKKIKKAEKKEKVNKYIEKANKTFSEFSISLFNQRTLYTLEKDLTRANLKFTPTSYLSVIMLTTVISFFVAVLLVLILLFFKISLLFPFISVIKEDYLMRFLKIFWMIFAFPIITFLGMYFYPSAEKKSLEQKIDQELPFATIHMSAIGGSMVGPNKIFEIMTYTKEYPALEKEFTKIINEINIYGYSLVSALKRTANNTSSKKFAELLNSLATNINSGGNTLKFFDERAKSLLFEYQLEKEKRTKSSETFMDIYISAVIAAPMILMLLLMMMKMSGFGIGLSVSAITIIMLLSVSSINVAFLIFLQLKQSNY
jgi:Flp pilus assembly protein TadB